MAKKDFNYVKKCPFSIQNEDKTTISLLIPYDTTLFLVNNGQKIYKNQIVAEIKKKQIYY